VRTSSFTETEGPLPSLRDTTGPHVEYPYGVSIRSILMVFYPSAIFPSGLLPVPWIEELFAHQFHLLDVTVCGRGTCSFWGLFIQLMACIHMWLWMLNCKARGRKRPWRDWGRRWKSSEYPISVVDSNRDLLNTSRTS